ncbi:hypothetical protein MMC11_003514 [Xylographa trunciseda]|nr:hypothetical protein [Xylographa trunciseda]
MATAKDSLIDLERRRKQLEDAVAHLRKSLQHWQIWEAEYEGLKEEILGLGEQPPIQDLQNLSVDFEGDLLTEPEIKRLLEDAGGKQRNADQILGLLSRRVDYVQQNVKTLTRQCGAAEDRLAAIDVVIQPEARSEEGLPLTEIIEELDEDGNVISSSISTPGESSKQVVEALRKAGVKDLPVPITPEVVAPSPAAKANRKVTNEHPNITYKPGTKPFIEETEKRTSSSPISISKSDDIVQAHNKQVVSSIYDAEADLMESLNSVHLTATKKLSTTSQNGNLARDTTSLIPEDVFDTVDAEDLHEYADGPTTESPEDAALRRQMLEYNMNEVGAIVAEMDLEESDSMTDYSEESDEENGSETDEEEDQYGRTTRRVVSDEYRRQMLELERKLNAKVLENVGPNPGISASEPSEHEIAIQKTDLDQAISSGTDTNKRKPKKGVRFADSLDISEVPPQAANPRPSTNAPSDPTPVADMIIERAPSNAAKPSITTPKKRQSKFKISQGPKPPNPAIQTDTTNHSPTITSNLVPPHPPARQVPTGPHGLTHAATLIERPSAPSSASAPPPDEYDPALMQQSLASEYHRMRTRMIQRSGGFLASEDEPAEEAIEDPQQPPAKRVSLFKRARLG